ncbi:MAG: hypothetical protein AAF652_15790 [Cyanobacteria bacterium P01_C01_bin.72]
MQFNNNTFNLHNPESWLIIMIYAIFWGYSYYSLIMLLIHTRQQHNLMEGSEKSLEITS